MVLYKFFFHNLGAGEYHNEHYIILIKARIVLHKNAIKEIRIFWILIEKSDVICNQHKRTLEVDSRLLV